MRSFSAYVSIIATAALVLTALGLLVAVTGALLPFGDWDRGGDHEASTTIHAPAAPTVAPRKDVLPAVSTAPPTAKRVSAAPSAGVRPPAAARPDRRRRAARPRVPARPAPPPARRPAVPPVRRPVAEPAPAPVPRPAPRPEQPARPIPAAPVPPPPATPSDAGRRPGPVHQVMNGLGDATRDLAETAEATVGRLPDVVRGLGAPPQP